MKKRRTLPGVRAALLVACALLVSLAQPLAALAALGDCARCGHTELDASCCCAPQESLAPMNPATPVVEESCCSEPAAGSTETELTSAHECSCKSVPDCPTIPVQLPPVQDITAASTPSRLVAEGCTISMRTVLGFEGPPKAPDVRGGSRPPGTESDNGTRLGRAAARGTSTLLAFLSVARL